MTPERSTLALNDNSIVLPLNIGGLHLAQLADTQTGIEQSPDYKFFNERIAAFTS